MDEDREIEYKSIAQNVPVTCLLYINQVQEGNLNIRRYKGSMDFSMKARPSEYRCNFLSLFPLKFY